jgi:O-antigen/teichoic acid export membrane protein
MESPANVETRSEHEARASRRVIAFFGRRVPREAFFYLAGEVGSRLLTFGSLLVLANFVAPAQFGLSALYFGLANLAAILLGLGLPNAVLRFHFDIHPSREVLGSICLMLGVSTLGAIAVVMVLSTPLAAFLHVPVPLLYSALAGGIGIAYRTAWTGSLRARRRTYAYVATMIGEPIAAVAIAVGWSTVAGAADYQVISWSFAIAALIVAAMAVATWARDPGFAWSTRVARILLVFSIPLVLHAFAMMAIATYDQIVINQALGPAEAGRYAYAYRWGMAMIALTAAFAAVWSPRFMELANDPAGRQRLDRMAVHGLTTIGLCAAVLMIVLPVVAIPFTPPEFLSALELIPIVVYAYVWYGLYTIVIAYGVHAKRTWRLAAVSAAVAVATTGCNYLLIPMFGIVTAALTSVAAYSALFGLHLWLVRDLAVDIRFRRLAVGALGLGVLPVLLFQIS